MKKLKESLCRSDEIQDNISNKVKKILQDIKLRGDLALQEYNLLFDQWNPSSLRVSREDIKHCYTMVDFSLIETMKRSIKNMERFSLLQKNCLLPLPLQGEDILMGHQLIPVDSVLCYIPGGRYPLFSTALMLITPAKIAGVPRVCGTTAPGKNKLPAPTIVAMDLAGADEIYLSGGAQTIGAFAYGTSSIKEVSMIVGPGNAYVAEAKRQCYGKVGIDFVAGPSEVLILADETANPKIIAADLLAQSEHDPLAKGILITNDENLGRKVLKEIPRQLATLPTAQIAQSSWENFGEIYVVDSWDQGIDLSNKLAPEHLEVMVEKLDITKLRHYGSLFLGPYSAEVFGDYTSGPNHTLPTGGASKYTGGLSVLTFIKIQTIQKLTKKGMERLSEDTKIMAEQEGLFGHKNAVDVRLDQC